MRIASIAKSNTEILAALGCTKEIVAATSYDKQLLGHGFVEIGSYTDINTKKIIGLKPDVVFTSTFLQQKYAEEFRENGLRVMHFDPLSVNDIMQNIIDAGKEVGREEKAKEVVMKMKKQIAEIRGGVLSSPVVKVYCEEWPSPPMAAGNWVIQMIEAAGGKGVLRQGERSRQVTLEEVTGFEPEQIVLNWCGVGMKAKTELVAKRKGWERIGAVRQKQIFVVDDSYFNTPSQNVVTGVMQLARLLHQSFNTSRTSPS